MTDSEKNETPAASGLSSSEEHPELAEEISNISNLYPQGRDALVKLFIGAASTAMRIASRTSEVPVKFGKAIIGTGDRARLMADAGESLKDMRKVAGWTLKDLSDAVNLPDQSLLAAVEKGTATLSFELILRMSALLARHDPVPFIMKFTRTYNPDLWAILEDWGLGRIPVQLERERKFINIFRSRDASRKVSDEGFDHVISVTQSAFEMALSYVMKQEDITDDKK